MRLSNRTRKRRYCAVLAIVFAILAAAAGPAMAAQPPIPQEGQLSGDWDLASDAFRGNALGDPAKRNNRFLLPKSYWDRNPDGSFVHPDYPVVELLNGNNMYGNEPTINAIRDQRCWPADGTPSLMPAANQATYCHPGLTLFDRDAILYGVMEETGKEFIFIETDILSRYGGTRYDCSPVFGDHPTYLDRDLPADIQQRFRIRPGRDNWFLLGFSGGAGGAFMTKLRDQVNRWGHLGLLSPSNNDLSGMTPPDALGRREPGLLNRFRNNPDGHVPQTDVSVNKLSGRDEIAKSWGKLPGRGAFIIGSLNATYQAGWPLPDGGHLAEDGVTPLYTVNPLTGPNVGDYDAYIWDNFIKPKGLKQICQRACDNLTDTVVVLARGNGKDALDVPGNPPGPLNTVLQAEVGDQPALIAELQARGHLDANTTILTPGDHFTSMKYTVPAVLKKLFELQGTKTGRPFTFQTALVDEHAPCADLFPRQE